MFLQLSANVNSSTFFSIKTAEKLMATGIPTTVVLDSAVAYCMDIVDFVLVGSEAVVESGGLTIAKVANNPFYALAESTRISTPIAQLNSVPGTSAAHDNLSGNSTLGLIIHDVQHVPNDASSAGSDEAHSKAHGHGHSADLKVQVLKAKCV
ncbi:hypothetical protein IW262DRAFT_1458160 [Armillaria fumosa]|nr:hypothetical protein IW262DRAFT_1458160 [Armillaria fumosa]